MTYKYMIQFTIIGLAMGLLSGCAASGANTVEDGAIVSEGGSKGRDGVATVGSRIKRSGDSEEGATPVKIYSQDDMRQTGAVSLGEFLGLGR